jgi:prophage regulatory protein
MENSSPRILRMQALKRKTGRGHSSIYMAMKEGDFPRPIKIGKRGVGWLEHEVDAWIKARVSQRDNAPEAA